MQAILMFLFVFAVSKSSEACSRTGSYQSDPLEAVQNTFDDEPKWQTAQLVSIQKLTENRYIYLVYNPVTRKCHKMSSKLYGGDGDCREKMTMTEVEDTPLSECGRNFEAQAPATCESLNAVFVKHCPSAKDALCKIENHLDYPELLDLFETRHELQRQAFQAAAEAQSQEPSSEVTQTFMAARGAACGISPLKIWTTLLADAKTRAPFEKSLYLDLRSMVIHNTSASAYGILSTSELVRIALDARLIVASNEPAARKQLSEIARKIAQKAVEKTRTLDPESSQMSSWTKFKFRINEGLGILFNKNFFFGLQSDIQNYSIEEMKSAQASHDELKVWWQRNVGK